MLPPRLFKGVGFPLTRCVALNLGKAPFCVTFYIKLAKNAGTVLLPELFGSHPKVKYTEGHERADDGLKRRGLIFISGSLENLRTDFTRDLRYLSFEEF